MSYVGTRAAPVFMKSSAFWSQVRVLTKANLKARYRKTFAGFFWVVMNPIIMFSVQGLVFRKILHINVNHYGLFLASGLIPWIFITQSIEMTMSIFISAGQLLKSYPVHPLVFLMAQLADNFINFSAAFLLVVIPISFYEHVPALSFFLLPLSLFFLAFGVVGICWFFATVQVFYRDTRFIMSFILSVGFFMTPIFYPIGFIPPSLKWIVTYNPFYRLIAPFRIVLMEFERQIFIRSLLGSGIVGIGFLGLAAWYWKKKRNFVYLNV